jgi:anti-sigma regulatory factor (Ser/Thr protein kinase)
MDQSISHRHASLPGRVAKSAPSHRPKSTDRRGAPLPHGGASQALSTRDDFSWMVPCDLAAVSQARKLTQQQVSYWGFAEHSDTAELLVTELVTNALTHGHVPIRLCLRNRFSGLRGEVSDCHPALPRLRPHEPDEEAGRGLQLLDVLASRWGVEPQSGGKTVWFELTDL